MSELTRVTPMAVRGYPLRQLVPISMGFGAGADGNPSVLPLRWSEELFASLFAFVRGYGPHPHPAGGDEPSLCASARFALAALRARGLALAPKFGVNWDKLGAATQFTGPLAGIFT